VLLQEGRPCKEYWEELLVPYVHYIPVDANLDNLTSAIEWGNVHLDKVERIVASANKLMKQVLSLNGIYLYGAAVLQRIAARQPVERPVVRIVGSKRFSCDKTSGECTFGTTKKSGLWLEAE
jgi:hypothetical protein